MFDKSMRTSGVIAALIVTLGALVALGAVFINAPHLQFINVAVMLVLVGVLAAIVMRARGKE
ncbi:hypothetical protein D4740_02130 [Actinomyces sp. 2119]|uniref:hypothetical protein n=1 Tax=Actinomyces sp. 2119 TaxID=2321393 RepID=UPI000E6CEB4D|nr:hypothetical protein [Actinomyces sp. 2119]RJF43793.1 hypothetical protein D4740_02130 [Actinomyces sp. 2119]